MTTRSRHSADRPAMRSIPAIEDTEAIALKGESVAVAGLPLMRRIAPVLMMLLALAPFTWVAYHYSDLPQFGKYQDDGLLLIAGKSLHDSGGYRIASLPGQPYQTKYPPLYPLLLSALWSLDGRFPENLRLVALSEWAIVVGFFAVAYLLIRSFGYSPWKAALPVAFLAVSPGLVYWALPPISDFVFALLVAVTFWV